jgi:AraC-like DNA-binding protein
MLHAPVSTRFVTSDPELGSARVAEVYADNRLRIHGQRDDFRFEQSRDDLGDLRFDRFSNTLVTEYAMEPLGHVIVVRMLDGEMDVWTDGTHRRLGTGDIALLSDPGNPYSTRVHGASMELIGVELALLDEAGGGRADRGRLRYEPLDAARASSWQRTVDYVTTTVLDERVQDSALVLGSAARHLGASLLAAFGVPDTVEGGAAGASTPSVIRRATGFCEANPHVDIGVVDIARACDVSVRTLQVAFRRHLDITPTAYLRRVRLDRVRADLLRSDPARVTVSGIASRWGFADASRFSAHYRAVYGEYPSDTLRRS